MSVVWLDVRKPLGRWLEGERPTCERNEELVAANGGDEIAVVSIIGTELVSDADGTTGEREDDLLIGGGGSDEPDLR